MDQIEGYLQTVPLPLVLAASFAALLALLAIPAHRRLPLALVIMPVWLTVARCPDLGIIQAVAKMSSFATYLAVALTAWMHPGPKRPVAPVVWVLPVMAVLAVGYVLTVDDRMWAAIGVCRIVVDAGSLTMVIKSLTVGCALSVMLPFSALLVDPAAAFGGGLGRFFPWGINPNQIGALLALSAPLFVYYAIRAPRASVRFLLVALAFVPIGMAVLTASRQTLAIIAGVMLPLLFYMTRRPGLTITGIVIVIFGVSWLFTIAPEVNVDRLATLETGRIDIAREYIAIIADRPLFGLLGVEGEMAKASYNVDTYPHNSFLEMLYVGGFSYFIPMFVVVVMAARSGIRVWFARRRLGIDPLLVSLLVGYLFWMFAHALVAEFPYYPTYAWSWFYVFLTAFVLTTDMELRRGEVGVPDIAEETGAWEDEYGMQPAHA
jgi:hypothetical protein